MYCNFTTIPDPWLLMRNKLLSCFHWNHGSFVLQMSSWFLFAGVQKRPGTDHQFCLRDVLSLTPRPAHSVHLRPHGVLPQHQWPHRLCYSGPDIFTRHVLSLTRKSRHHLFSCVLSVAFEWVKSGGSGAAAEVIQPGGQLHHQPVSVYCSGPEEVPFLPHSQSWADGTSLRWVCHPRSTNKGDLENFNLLTFFGSYSPFTL